MRGPFAGRKHRGNRRVRRILKVFGVGAGLGAIAGLLSPPKQTKVARTTRPVGEDSVKPFEAPAEVIETEAASEQPAERPAAAKRSKRSVTAKVSEKPASKKTPKPRQNPKPRQKPGGKTRQDPSK